jgi:hypothetical protein
VGQGLPMSEYAQIALYARSPKVQSLDLSRVEATRFGAAKAGDYSMISLWQPSSICTDTFCALENVWQLAGQVMIRVGSAIPGLTS